MYTEGFVRGAARQPRPVAGGAVYTVRVPRHRRGRQPVVLGGQRDALPVGEVVGEVQPEVILGEACGIAGSETLAVSVCLIAWFVPSLSWQMIVFHTYETSAN